MADAYDPRSVLHMAACEPGLSLRAHLLMLAWALVLAVVWAMFFADWIRERLAASWARSLVRKAP